MVENKDQVTPLTLAANHRSSGDGDEHATAKKPGRKKCIRCCACIAALMLIQATAVVILIFTVFRVKDPVIIMNGVTVTNLELNGSVPKAGTNMSLIASVSVKNPNVATFRYSNTTTTLNYHGLVVGEARGPPGEARARRTVKMNITVDIITDRIMSSPNLSADVGSGLLPMSSYSRIGGRVNVLNIIKKHVTVEMKCTITMNMTSRAIQDQKCKRHVNL